MPCICSRMLHNNGCRVHNRDMASNVQCELYLRAQSFAEPCCHVRRVPTIATGHRYRVAWCGCIRVCNGDIRMSTPPMRADDHHEQCLDNQAYRMACSAENGSLCQRHHVRFHMVVFGLLAREGSTDAQSAVGGGLQDVVAEHMA